MLKQRQWLLAVDSESQFGTNRVVILIAPPALLQMRREMGVDDAYRRTVQIKAYRHPAFVALDKIAGRHRIAVR